MGLLYMTSGKGAGDEGLYSEIQCMLRNGHVGTPDLLNTLTEMIDNTSPKLRW